MQTSPTLPATGFLRLPQVLALVPVSRTSWWDMVREGRAPASVKLGPRTTVWRAEDVRDFIERPGDYTAPAKKLAA